MILRKDSNTLSLGEKCLTYNVFKIIIQPDNIYVQYKNPIRLSLGKGALQYHFKINPQIIYGFKRDKMDKGWSTQTKVLVTVGIFVIGFLAGAKTGFSLSR